MDPDLWANLDPDRDPGQEAGLCWEILRGKHFNYFIKNYFLNFFNYKKIMASKEFVTVIVESPIGEFVS